MAVPFPVTQIVVTGVAGNTRTLNGTAGQARADNLRWGDAIPGGCSEFSFRIADDERLRHPFVYRYGAIATLSIAATDYQGNAQTDAGFVLWQGTLLTPTSQDGGTSTIRCAGWIRTVAQREEHLLWQDRYIGNWADADDDPFEKQSFDQANNIEVGFTKTAMSFRIKKTMPGGERSFILYYPEDEPDDIRMTSVWFRRRTANGADPTLHLWVVGFASGDGDAGDDVTQGAEVGLPPGRDTTAFQRDITAPNNRMIGFVLRKIGAASIPDNNLPFRCVLTRVKVNGNAFRRAADYPRLEYPASEMMKDLASRLGFDGSGIETTYSSYLPLYWQGNSWTDLIDYLTLGPGGYCLAADIDNSTTSISVWETGTPPVGAFTITIGKEQLRVTARAAGFPATWTVTRAFGGTKPRSHDGGDGIKMPSNALGNQYKGMFQWGVWPGTGLVPKITWRSWDSEGVQTWHVYGFTEALGNQVGAHAIVEVEGSEDMYSEVDVQWNRKHSVRVRHAITPITPNPFSGLPGPSRTRRFRIALQDSFRDNTLPQAISQAIAQELSTPQLNARVKLSWADVDRPYDQKAIATGTRAAGVWTITTATAHGLPVGASTVLITGTTLATGARDINGRTFTVTRTGPTTFTFSDGAGAASLVANEGSARRTGNTLTQTTAHTIRAGDKLRIEDYPVGVLLGNITAGATTITIRHPAASVDALPAFPFFVRLPTAGGTDEWVRATAATMPSAGQFDLTVVRGVRATTAAAHSNGSKLFMSQDLRIYETQHGDTEATLSCGRSAGLSIERMLWRYQMTKIRQGKVEGNTQ